MTTLILSHTHGSIERIRYVDIYLDKLVRTSRRNEEDTMTNEWTEKIEKLEEERAKALKLLRASSAGLKSYQYGNSSPDLAEHIAREIDSFLSMSGTTS